MFKSITFIIFLLSPTLSFATGNVKPTGHDLVTRKMLEQSPNPVNATALDDKNNFIIDESVTSISATLIATRQDTELVLTSPSGKKHIGQPEPGHKPRKSTKVRRWSREMVRLVNRYITVKKPELGQWQVSYRGGSVNHINIESPIKLQVNFPFGKRPPTLFQTEVFLTARDVPIWLTKQGSGKAEARVCPNDVLTQAHYKLGCESLPMIIKNGRFVFENDLGLAPGGFNVHFVFTKGTVVRSILKLYSVHSSTWG